MTAVPIRQKNANFLTFISIKITFRGQISGFAKKVVLRISAGNVCEADDAKSKILGFVSVP